MSETPQSGGSDRLRRRVVPLPSPGSWVFTPGRRASPPHHRKGTVNSSNVNSTLILPSRPMLKIQLYPASVRPCAEAALGRAAIGAGKGDFWAALVAAGSRKSIGDPTCQFSFATATQFRAPFWMALIGAFEPRKNGRRFSLRFFMPRIIGFPKGFPP